MSQELFSAIETTTRIAIPAFLSVIFIFWMVGEAKK
jgi:hypothetical protein